MKKTSIELELAGKKLTFETGDLAVQSTSSVLARLGDTVVLVTVVEGGKTELDYFPLSVEYVERLYAGGKIKGSRWVKREGRPSDEAILAGRLIDRSIRPLFPKAFKNEVQVIVTVLSVDGENEPDIVALNAVSAAIAISRIPWNGPIGAVRVGAVLEAGNGKTECIVNPGTEQEFSELDLVASQTKEKTVMIEAGANQIGEDILVQAIEKAHSETQKIIAGIEELIRKIGAKKLEVPEDSELHEMVALVEKSYKAEVESLIESRVNKEGSGDETGALIDKIYDGAKVKDGSSEVDKKTIAAAIEKVMFNIIREGILTAKKRADGRKLDEIRPIEARVGILPRTHGSALFQRGITQALSVVTLGSPRMEQLIESAEGEESKRYIHHYSGLPYSFGQTGRVGTPSRREIGHGALAERALEAVIPTQADFPYTIRVVSEVLSQNGSSSMASTCGSTLALMDAGVPIRKPVAGISIGMVSNEKSYELLTDIIGLEDFSGDMDFKVAGTDQGVTAIQLDVKIPGLTIEQIKNIFERAKSARAQILEKMLAIIPEPRKNLSEYAPKIETVQIPVDKIGELIGPGGKMIKHIIASTGAQVDVEDSGTVTISGVDETAVAKATEWVKNMMREVKPGEVFEEAEVKRMLPFGAFVEILPGKEGMVHVSQMSADFVKNPADVVNIGDKVKVRVIEIDEQGRINLSMKFGPDADKPRGGGGGEDRPYHPHRRPSFDPQGGRPPIRGPRHDDPNTGPGDRSAHPLAMQFRREREEKFRRDRGGRGPRPASRLGGPFKKTHY
ncbi:MAG: polyribonucleotide nucleotidyltransferase [Candidatus Levybacteria bacterium]|nr:polyribonucleotide nucleotidyltransferase [Candidatus Levybacteria bacterium]